MRSHEGLNARLELGRRVWRRNVGNYGSRLLGHAGEEMQQKRSNMSQVTLKLFITKILIMDL